MADLIVLGFKDMTRADDAVQEIQAMQSENLIRLADWARVIRRQDGKVDIRQGISTTGAGAVGGSLWGMLFGLIFLMPLAGAAIGAATGAIMGALTDVGIDDKLIKGLGKQIGPGTSALFLYVVDATPDKVVDRMRQFEPEILRSSLSNDAEARLKAMMAGTPA